MSGFFLPTEGAEGAVLSLPVIAAASLTGLLLFLALRASSGRDRPMATLFAFAGMAVAIGATVYVHDVVNLPEIAGALVAGAGLGYLVARQTSHQALLSLAVILHGLTGVVAAITGWSAVADPAAFGIAESAAMPSWIAACVAVLIGAAMVAMSSVILLRPKTGATTGLAWLASGAGWAAAALGFAFGSLVMIVAGGMLGAAGATLGLRWRGAGQD